MNLEFIAPGEKAAVTILSTPHWLETAKAALAELGYKVHAPQTHEEFSSRFSQFPYQVVITEGLFAASTPSENLSLIHLQRMPMQQRRHAVVLLIGREFETLNAMQAFQASVHAVVNPQELPSLRLIVQQVVADNDLLLAVYRDTQLRLAQARL
jgi:hypothetical protein